QRAGARGERVPEGGDDRRQYRVQHGDDRSGEERPTPAVDRHAGNDRRGEQQRRSRKDPRNQDAQNADAGAALLHRTATVTGTSSVPPIGSTRTSKAAASSANRRAGSCSSRSRPTRVYVPQWIGTAMRGRSSSSAWAARAASRCPGGSRGPQPAIGSSARSTGASSRMPSKRSVSPAK